MRSEGDNHQGRKVNINEKLSAISFSTTTTTKLTPEKNPDVHIIVIDSVASSQIIRALPQTVNFLLHGMNAVQFRKFNKIGSNSRPNALALFFGKSTENVVRSPMNLPNLNADLDFEQICERYLDNETYIPIEYRDAGYKTLGAEDCWITILDHPVCHGMKQKVVHHSYRTFRSRSTEDSELKKIHYHGVCHSPKFSYSWLVEIAHDNTRNLYRADSDLYEFLVKNRMALNNSFIFLLGDHGPRLGKEAETAHGNREQNNPFLYVVVPEYLRKKQIYKQLRQNSEQLVTPHDLHSTLKDILYFQPTSSFTDTSFMKYDSNPYGSSLLRKFEHGVRRTCKTLPIPFQHCICQFKTDTVSDLNLTRTLGEFAAQRLAGRLEMRGVSSVCEDIALGKVISVEKYQSCINKSTNTTTYSNYEVVFEVAPPANGRFQILVRIDRDRLQIDEEQPFIRLSVYGKNGQCMKGDALRPLCTCRKNLDKNL
ncbi:hypothetical protein DICVIV_04674 [Dictyocaulus viviparus]|uniref:Arylsulfatase n=1 Tax=Dictyocaulus viviparus TaxID=29172 RepID=A0A0D8XX10_DICVI|nr:hypothetical protein DICVIV_04674 [Dictyocaulus viviparus]